MPFAALLVSSSSLRLSLGECPGGPVTATATHSSCLSVREAQMRTRRRESNHNYDTLYARIAFMLPFSMGFPPRRRISHDSMSPLI